MVTVSRFLFTIAQSWVGTLIIGWSFAHMSSFLPVDKLYETELVIAFQHPKPSYQTHILIVPKRQIKSVMTLAEADVLVITDVIATTQHLVKELVLDEKGFRLVVNGGAYQDVMQIHWHLISDE